MVQIHPFRGWRFSQALLPLITAPPFDAIDKALQQQLWQRHPQNVVRLTRPIEGPAQAAHIWQTWQQQGIVTQDAQPCFTLYRQQWQGQTRTGLLALLDLREPELIVPHEATLYGPIQDRLALLYATQTQVCPLYLLYPGERLPDWPAPATGFDDADGINHQVWTVFDDRYIAQIQSMLASHPVLIADGHHRYVTLQQYRQETGNPYALVFLAHVEDAQVLPTHRGFRQLPFDLLAAMAQAFTAQGDDLVCITPYDQQGFTVSGLPVQALESLLNQYDTSSIALRETDRIRMYPDLAYPGLTGHNLAGLGLDLLVKVKPPELTDVLGYCQTGLLMPLKSTYIVPKPLSGAVIYAQ